MRVDDRTRAPRVSLPLLGRPVPNRWRHPILDDALLGSAWRWDADDDRNVSSHWARLAELGLPRELGLR